MTKTEFGKQFQRLRVAGYRLPVFDGVKVTDVIDEWYATFGGCTEAEFAEAIDRLKKAKTDTFWPATGELWAQVFEIRKARKIRAQSVVTEGHWAMSNEDANDFLSMLRECKQRILAKMTMPHAEPQVEPDHVLREREEREEPA